MEDNRKIICEHCHNSVPISEIRYMPKGLTSKIALCLTCRTKDNKENKPVEKKEVLVEQLSSKTVYFCDRCKYKFKYDPVGNLDLRCPYCGKTDKVRKHELPSAERILNSV